VPRRVRIDLAYDGTAYDGWQIQPGRPTVQGTVEACLTRLHGGERVKVRGAGRTDAGVHARGQVADALVSDRLSDEALLRALRALLPADVGVLGVATVPETFHARHDAVAKTYGYYVDRTRAGDPFLARFVLHERRALDEGALDDALARLPGTRDWSGFASSQCVVQDRVRTLRIARREPVRRGVDALVFTADGFLTHMVRNIVGTVLDVAAGRFGGDRIDAILARGDRALAGPTAPPHGLTLERVDYSVSMRAAWERSSSQAGPDTSGATSHGT
jgi:tRNA pseudouridine38-40 synthase